MKNVVTLVLSCAVSATPILAAGGQAPGAASLTGTATSSSGRTMSNAAVRLRNLTTGQVSATTASNGAGQFSFVGLTAGNYTVEVVNAAGQIIGATSSVALAADSTISGVVVAASAEETAAAPTTATATAGGSTGVSTTALIVTSVAAAAGAAGIAVATRPASPSR